MKMFLLSADADTLTGMRFAGVEGRYIQRYSDFIKAWDEAMTDKGIGILLISESLSGQFEDVISEARATKLAPLIISIPDRHSKAKGADFISKYIREAAGVR